MLDFGQPEFGFPSMVPQFVTLMCILVGIAFFCCGSRKKSTANKSTQTIASYEELDAMTIEALKDILRSHRRELGRNKQQVIENVMAMQAELLRGPATP